MDKIARQIYNASFSEDKYAKMLEDITRQYNHRPHFRVAESPVFISKELKAQIFDACEDISNVVVSPNFKKLTEGALKPEYTVPNEDDHSLFLQYDFGICEEDGKLIPKLIEAQGFPTLYFYQDLIANMYRKYFDIATGFDHLFGGLDQMSYRNLMKKAIMGDHNPENVILLELEPQSQATQIDFWATAEALGIKVLCLTELVKEGKDLYYFDDSRRKIPVFRIYNRVIFDELVGRKDLKFAFQFTDEINAEWAGHPNWFFRLSKYTLPLFKSKYVPETQYLDRVQSIPTDLENYVLKPLYSFSGSGVIFNLTKEHFDAIDDPSDFILQRKVKYAPVIQAPDGLVKCEIRMLMLWEPGQERPRIVNNLSRLTKGEMVGVKFNKDKTWVGGSVAFFET